MSEIKTLQEKIEGKLKMLKFTIEDTEKVLETEDVKAIKRHWSTLESIIDETHQPKLQAQELRIENNEDLAEIRSWLENLEAQINKFEGTLKQVKYVAANIRSAKEEKREEEKRKRIMNEEIKFEKAKFQARAKLEKSLKTSLENSENSSSIGVKLPKLEISKFQGTFLDWTRFWNQFETEINKAKLTQVAKFSYLKELLVPSIHASIDGLPFTTAGYEWAKHVLKTKYGKSSEVANAHTQCIIGLSTIHGVDSAKIHEFHEKLTRHIQVLETMGKVKEIGGFVRATLDKLPDIRADLVRLDDNWQEWGFPELIESLRKWCDHDPIPNRDQMPSTPDSDHSHRDPSIRSPPNRGLPIRDSWTQYPSYHHSRNRHPPRKNPAYQTKDESAKVAHVCVFCNSEDHRSAECGKFPNISQRRRILSDKKLCFNCTGTRHQAQDL